MEFFVIIFWLMVMGLALEVFDWLWKKWIYRNLN